MSELFRAEFLNPVYLMNFRPLYLIPDRTFRTIADIPEDLLEFWRIKGICFDVDNTLCKYHGEAVDPRIRKRFDELTSKYKSCILSNTTAGRMQNLESYFGIPVVKTDAKKPSPKAFLDALAFLETKPFETLMIGDRLITDISGANRVGMYTIKTRPLSPMSEPTAIMIARDFESLLNMLYYPLFRV